MPQKHLPQSFVEILSKVVKYVNERLQIKAG